jgi:septin family protein
MTVEERLDRIEHVTAGFAEQYRKEREEDRMLWRATQQHITELGDEMREADKLLSERIEQWAKEAREEDARLGKRIESVNAELGKRIDDLGKRIEDLVSAIGTLVARLPLLPPK